jgi:pimeloyl-ACP methyl ester carboxylesterase
MRSPAAPWVVFVHGAGGSSSIWYKQVRDFRREFNVLLLDLRGHGRSKNLVEEWRSRRGYTFSEVSADIVRVLDYCGIAKAHFVGISLGTIIIRALAEQHPKRVASLIMAGAIIRFNIRSNLMLWAARLVKRLVPYMWLYRLYAWVLMPRKRHSESRNLFVIEAKKLYQKEFLRWMKTASSVVRLMRCFRERELSTPTMYVMGDEDYMFLPSVIVLTRRHRSAVLHIVEDSGHVCNVDQPEAFNLASMGFIRTVAQSAACAS